MVRGDIVKLVKSSESAEALQHRQDITIWIAAPNSFFWLHGILGSGKTIFSSAVIDALEDFGVANQANKLAVAFFYFNYRAPARWKQRVYFSQFVPGSFPNQNDTFEY